MPAFEYTALNPEGRKVKGAIDAENIRAARQKLRGQGIFPTDIREGAEASQEKSRDIKRYFQSDRVGLRDLATSTRQLATLVGAGLPLVSALQALSEQTDNATLRRIIVDVRENVEGGSALAKAFGNFPKAFPPLYINLVNSGEASGTLDTVLLNLADYLEAQVELRRRVMSALMYPILMLIICTLVVSGLLMYVVPKIVEIFQKQGAILPLPTRIMIGFSDLLIGYWFLILLAGALLTIFLRWYYRQPQGRLRFDRLVLELPIYGTLYKKICTARVASTLGTLLSSGVGLLTGLDITKNIINNVHMSKSIDDAREGVREGRSLARELGRSGLFPSMLGHMIAVGEASGQLEEMLRKAGQAYEKDVNAALDGLTSLLEPLLMIIVGAIVLAIVISVLLPMADLINVVQK